MKNTQNDRQIIDKINRLENQKDSYITQKNWPKIRRVPFQGMRADLILVPEINQISVDSPYCGLNNYLPNLINFILKENLEVDKLEISNLPSDIRTSLYRDDSDTSSFKMNFQEENRNYLPNIDNISNEDLLKIAKILAKEYLDFLKPYYNLAKYNYFGTQGPTFYSLHFEYEFDNFDKNAIHSDYSRSRTTPDQMRRITSNLQIAAFYDRSLINFEAMPDERLLLFWLAFDNLIQLNDNEKTKLAQLLNTDGNYLENDEQRAAQEAQESIKELVNNKQFQNDVIEKFMGSFKPWPNEGVTEITIDNIKNNMPDKNHIVYIVHALDENLNDLEKQFKYVFLGQVQGLYKQYYKSQTGQKPQQELTEEQIEIIKNIYPKIKRSSIFPGYSLITQIKNFLDRLTKNDKEAIYSDTYFFELKKDDKKTTADNFIQTIKDIGFPDLDINLDSLSGDQKNILIGFVDLSNSNNLNLSPKEKIELLNYAKKDKESFNKFFDEYVENPKFNELNFDNEIKNFMSYLFERKYKPSEGMIENFNSAPAPEKKDYKILDNFLNAIKSFDLYQPPTSKEINNKLTDCFKNAIIKIENEIIPFEKWSRNHQIHQIHQITDGEWVNFTTLGNGFLKAASEGKIDLRPTLEEFNKGITLQEKRSILLSAINVKISLYPPKKQIKIVHKLTSSQFLKPEIKQEILMKYSQTPGNGFIKALARGELEFNEKTAQYFLKKIFNLYKNNYHKAIRLKTKILNDPKTDNKFKAYLSGMEFNKLIKTFAKLDENKDKIKLDTSIETFSKAHYSYATNVNENKTITIAR